MKAFFIFALIFIPVVWYLSRALRYTDATVGDHSPLKTVVTYHTSVWQHFTQPGFISWLLLGAMLFPLPILVVTNLGTATSPWHYGIALFTIIAVLWYVYALYILIQLHRRFWRITKGVRLTLDPDTKSISVGRNGSSKYLQTATIKKIAHHFAALDGADLYKGYNYYEFVGFDDTVTILNGNPAALYFAIDDYFKNVPQTSHSDKIPWPPADVTYPAAELC